MRHRVTHRVTRAERLRTVNGGAARRAAAGLRVAAYGTGFLAT